MKVISFHTGDGEYPKLAQRLSASCERFGLHHEIIRIPKERDWAATCSVKPAFILESILESRGPVLWVDVDCEILRLPSLFWRGGHDFQIYNYSADVANGERFPNTPENTHFASGVVYAAYTAPVLELFVRWCDQCRARPGVVDDQVLDEVWRIKRPPVNAKWLPRTANWMPHHFGPPTPEVYIRHDCVMSPKIGEELRRASGVAGVSK